MALSDATVALDCYRAGWHDGPNLITAVSAIFARYRGQATPDSAAQDITAMYAAVKANGWKAVPEYNTATMYLMLPRANAAIVAAGIQHAGEFFQVPDPGDVTKIPAGIAGALQTMAASVVKTYNWISDRGNIARIVEVGIGAAVLIAGLYVIARPVIQPAVDKAKAVGDKVSTAATLAVAPEAAPAVAGKQAAQKAQKAQAKNAPAQSGT